MGMCDISDVPLYNPFCALLGLVAVNIDSQQVLIRKLLSLREETQTGINIQNIINYVNGYVSSLRGDASLSSYKMQNNSKRTGFQRSHHVER